MAAIPEFGEAHLQRVCDILAETSTGLTGSEIGRLLRQLQIADPEPSATKRHRLFAALNARQHRDRCGNNVADRPDDRRTYSKRPTREKERPPD
jgi:hypothetical protein